MCSIFSFFFISSCDGTLETLNVITGLIEANLQLLALQMCRPDFLIANPGLYRPLIPCQTCDLLIQDSACSCLLRCASICRFTLYASRSSGAG